MVEKIRYLESIRGLGALSVVIFHFLDLFMPACVTGSGAQVHLGGGLELLFFGSPLNLLYAGPGAVEIFFVLSGFVLTCKFFRTGDTRALVSGMARRYFRLVPLVLFSELAFFACSRLGLFAAAARLPALTLTQTWTDHYLAHASLVRVLSEALWGTFFTGANAYNIPLWTMTFEFYGSFLVLAVALVSAQLRSRPLLYAVLLLALWQTHYASFVLGMLLADLSSQPALPLRRLPGWLTGLGGLVGLLLISYTFSTAGERVGLYGRLNLPGWHDLRVFFYMLGSFLVVLALLHAPRAQKLLALRPFVWLGQLSFPMYALHWLILGSLSASVYVRLAALLDAHLAVLITLLVSLAAIFGLSALAARWVDAPGIRFSGWVYRRVFQPAVEARPHPAAAEAD